MTAMTTTGGLSRRRRAHRESWRMAMIKLSAFRWVPPFAQGLVRDLRVRWALEEAGIPFEERLIGPEDQATAAYRALQPFGQVPAIDTGELKLFESGAIVLHIAERSETGRCKMSRWPVRHQARQGVQGHQHYPRLMPRHGWRPASLGALESRLPQHRAGWSGPATASVLQAAQSTRSAARSAPTVGTS